MKQMLGWVSAVLLVVSCAREAEPQQAAAEAKAPLRVFIRAGVKTHGPGEHDHPRFLEEWKPLLEQRGCKVDGALVFPTPEQLAATDVLVIFAAEAGTMTPEQKASLETFTKRGGGIVTLHDGVCGKEPMWFKTVIGGAWEHGYSKWHHGTNGFYVQDTPHPITAGLSNFFVDDEIYWNLHLEPAAQVIGTSFRMFNEITPQMWVYEKDAYRSFVCLLGHKHATFGLPHVRAILMRGIAWAAKREVDSLVSREELASLRYPPGGPLPLDRMAGKIAVSADFDLKAVLGEPDVVKPISMAWDEKGRLWVLQTPMYPAKAATWKTRPYDSLAVYENANGLPGKRTLFYEQLDLPTGLVLHKDGAIVMAAPEILFLRDTDGDGVADKREVLFSGFGFGDTHATASNLRWGLDGWVYATQGYSGGGSNVANKDGKPCGRIPNGLFRFRPDGTEIETVVAYGGNSWGMDFSWDHEILFSMANGSHLRHVVLPDAVVARGKTGRLEGWKDVTDHRDANPPLKHTINPYLQIDNVGGFTAAAGGTLYDGGAWPDEYRKIHLVTECTINLVHQDRVEPDGVTYKASKVRAEEFMGGTDLWFRPVDTQIGPDGALYVADFYNMAVVHNDTRGPKHGPFNAAVRPDRDHLHGRILRLQHKQARALPATDFASVPGLVSALEHPNRWARQTAQRLLVERGAGASELEGLLKSSSKPEARVAALWTLHRLGKLGAAVLSAVLGDADGGVRKNAARVAALSAKDEGVKKALLDGLDDADPRARLEKIVALQSLPLDGAAAAALIKLSGSLTDPWSKSAVVGALAASPAESIAAAIEAGDKALVEALAENVGLRQDGDLAARAFVTMAGKGDAALRASALGRLSRALRPDVAPSADGGVRKALEGLLSSGDAALVSAAVPFAARWVKDDSLAKVLEPVGAVLLAAIGDAAKPDEARLQNLQAALSLGFVRAKAYEAAGALLAPSVSGDLQKGAIEILGAQTDEGAAKLFIGSYPRLAGTARELALGQLFKRPEWTMLLVADLEAGGLKPADLGPSAVFRLRTHPDAAVSARATKVIDALVGASAKAKDQVVAQLLPEVEKAGDLVRGKALLVENCLKCHQYKGEGRAIAPDLTGMGLHGKRDLLVAVLDPNRTVEANYVSFNVMTRSGEVFNGLVARESRDSVVLKNNEGDKEIRRADIQAMKSTGLSLMPEGLESLGPAVLRDILSYLCSDTGGFRLVDLQPAFSASTVKGLYDERREPHNLKLKKFGLTMVDGIPFQVVDPSKSPNGLNAIVLKGGAAADWDSKKKMPQKVDFRVGFAAPRIHVLGGIAAWGTLDGAKSPEPAVKVTFAYADGQAETLVLHDSVEFSDWVRRVDVKGSKYVDLLEKGARGQVRWFTMRPKRKDAVIERISLESYDNQLAPTFLAMTADLSGEEKGHVAPQEPPPAPLQLTPSKILMVGGGASHDFNRWFRDGDAKLIDAAYTDRPAQIAAALPGTDLLVISNNQPIPDPAARKGIFDHLDAGKGLVVVHAGAWYNWGDWKDWNKVVVGGGSRGHEKLQDFEVEAVESGHPVMAGVPATFRVKDELYFYAKDKEGPEVQVLAKGRSLETGKEWPVVLVVKHPKARIVVITLGHDGAAHNLPAYQALLKNAVAWAKGGK